MDDIKNDYDKRIQSAELKQTILQWFAGALIILILGTMLRTGWFDRAIELANRSNVSGKTSPPVAGAPPSPSPVTGTRSPRDLHPRSWRHCWCVLDFGRVDATEATKRDWPILSPPTGGAVLRQVPAQSGRRSAVRFPKRERVLLSRSMPRPRPAGFAGFPLPVFLGGRK